MIRIIFNENKHCAIALDEDKEVGICEYVTTGDSWDIVHTYVDSNYQGQGIARNLVGCVITEARDRNISLTSSCSYANKILNKDN